MEYCQQKVEHSKNNMWLVTTVFVLVVFSLLHQSMQIQRGICMNCRVTRSMYFQYCDHQYRQYFKYGDQIDIKNAKHNICNKCQCKLSEIKKFNPNENKITESKKRTKSFSERNEEGQARKRRRIRDSLEVQFESREEAIKQIKLMYPDLIIPESITTKIMENVDELFQQLNESRNTLTIDLFKILLNGISTSAAVNTFSYLNRNSVAKAKYSSRKSILFSMHYTPHDVHRTRISTTEKETIIQFWIKNTTPSPSRTIKLHPKAKENTEVHCVHWQMIGTKQLYLKYCAETIDPVSIGTFINLRPKFVKHGSMREGVCGTCRDGRTAERIVEQLQKKKTEYQQRINYLNAVNTALFHVQSGFACDHDHEMVTVARKGCPPNLPLDIHINNEYTRVSLLCDDISTKINIEQPKIDEYKKHQPIVEHQQRQYELQLENLHDHQAIVIMDFAATYQLGYKAVESTDEWFNKRSVQDLVIVVIIRQNDQYSRHYFDYLCEKESHDTLFVRQAWHHLLKTSDLFQNIDEILLWSDGGPHHFKIFRTLYLMWQLQHEYDITIQYNFFASAHGKSLCDAHIGVSKQRVRMVAKTEHDVDTVQQLRTVLLTLKNTTAIDLVSIDRTNRYDVEAFDSGIKKYHQFRFDDEPVVFCHELSNVGDGICEILQPIDDSSTQINVDETDAEIVVEYSTFDADAIINDDDCQKDEDLALEIALPAPSAAIFCNCQKGCKTKSCKCKQNGIHCGPLCHKKIIKGMTECENK